MLVLVGAPAVSGATAGLAAPLAIAGAVAAVYALYLALLAFAAFRDRAPEASGAPTTRVAILVPAHDEATLIERSVRALRAQAYPADLFDVVVVADNCTDDTAVLAARAGARVLVRDEPSSPGKGPALAWAFGNLLAEEPPWAAIAVVDADAVVAPDFLGILVRPLEAGAGAVQGESLLEEDGTPRTALRAAAFLLVNRVRPAGRAALGLSGNLCGTGMLLARDVLVATPWSAFTSAEDLEYTLQLRLAGTAVARAAGAVVLSPAAPNERAAEQQRLRWEGGRRHLVREWVPRFMAAAVKERRPALLDAAFDLSVPPLALLTAGTAAGAALSGTCALAGVAPWPIAPWLVALASIALFVLVGLRAAGAPASTYRALTYAPTYAARKALHVGRLRGFDANTWVRTERRAGR